MPSPSSINASYISQTPPTPPSQHSTGSEIKSGDESPRSPGRRVSSSGPLAPLSRSSSKEDVASSSSPRELTASSSPAMPSSSSRAEAPSASGSGAVKGQTSYAGEVKKTDGKLTSGNSVVNALLKYAGADDATSDINRLEVSTRTSLKMTLPADVKQQLAALSEAVGGDLIHVLQKVVASGSEGLGEHGASMLTERLTAAAPTVSSNHPALAQHVNDKIAGNHELQLRLGAEALLQVATEKKFGLVGLAGSIAVSAGIGSGWELGIAPLVKDALFSKGFSPSKFGLKLAGVDSVPPLVIETLDTLCVLVALKAMRGEKDWSLKDLLPNALKAGAISSVFSYPNNVLEYMSTGFKAADTLLNAVTTEAAIFSAATGVPLDVKESEEDRKEVVEGQIHSGLLAPPPVGQTLDQYVRGIVDRAMAISPGDSIAQKSMGFAAVVGLLPLVLSSKVTNALSDKFLRILRSTVFNPIEAISLNCLVATSKLNIPGIMPSDYQKHAHAIVRLLENAHPGDHEGISGHVDNLHDEELHRILAPRREFLRQTGESVIWGMNKMFHGLSSVAGGLNQGAHWAAGTVSGGLSLRRPSPNTNSLTGS